MKNIILIILATNLLSCTSIKTTNFNNNTFNSSNEQVIFFTKKPNREYEEKATIEFFVIPRNQNKIFDHFKKEMTKNNFDAVIDVKSEIFASSYILTLIRYVGIGIKYNDPKIK